MFTSPRNRWLGGLLVRIQKGLVHPEANSQQIITIVMIIKCMMTELTNFLGRKHLLSKSVWLEKFLLHVVMAGCDSCTSKEMELSEASEEL